MTRDVRTLEHKVDAARRRLLLNQEERWKIEKALVANRAELVWIEAELAELEAELVRGRDGLTAKERIWFMTGADDDGQPVSTP